MAGRIIKLRLQGSEADNGDVRFEDFIAQMQAFLDALEQADRLVSHQKTLYYTVVDLNHNSPSEVTIEANPIQAEIDYSEAAVTKLVDAINTIGRGDPIPDEFDYRALKSLRKLVDTRGGRIVDTAISNNGVYIHVEKEAPRNIDAIITQEEYVLGSVTGSLEHINTHGKEKVFTIYPAIGPKSVRCLFSGSTIREEARSRVDQWVTVYGLLKYRGRSDFPYEIAVESIEGHSSPDTPTLESIRGLAPGLTGNQTAGEFVEELRLG